MIKKGLHVTDLNETLVIVGQLCDDGCIVVFTAKESIVLDLNKFSVDE